MFFFFDINGSQTEINAAPKRADIAIVPTNSGGSLGELNEKVIREFGYETSILDTLDLKNGYGLFLGDGRSILFIVTVGQGSTEISLKTNLRNALIANLEVFRNKRIWIPLMGTGIGKLSYEKSYIITSSILDNMKDDLLEMNCQFIFSLPDNIKGKELFKLIKNDHLHSVSGNRKGETVSGLKPGPINKGFKKIDELINQLNATFYFVGKDWEGSSQLKRFYEEGIWETGYSDRYSGTIKNIVLGDILIIQQPYAIGTKNNSEILAIGRVSETTRDERSVKVNWILKNLAIRVQSKGYNKSTITALHPDSVKEIFSKISSKDLAFFRDTLLVKEKGSADLKNLNRTTLPGISADTEKGEDYFDIREDVEAFARVMATKSFEPPLAIALLGKWGSGKSFFMNKLKEEILHLSSKKDQSVFCEGIAHVHFNAWSYMDSNLWASIITRIFEGLEQYIKNSSASDQLKKEIEQELFQKLTISKEELKTLNDQRKKVDEQIKVLDDKRTAVKKDLDDKISQIRKSTFTNLINKVNEDFNVKDNVEKTLNDNPTFTASAEKFKKIIPSEYWDNPQEFLKQLKSVGTFLKVFFHREKFWTNITWLFSILLLVVVLPLFLYIFNLQLSWQDFTISKTEWISICFIGGIITRSADTFIKLKKQIAPFWRIKEDYETKKKHIVADYEQEEKALRLEIQNLKEEILILDKQIIANEQLKANLEFKLKNALSTEALYTFIEKRASSEDYKKHLGIISLIRKDFEILSGLLTGHKTELVTNKESVKFKEMFADKKPLERIILYIDDLDRCPEERVVEVLEAVNLLMAFPLFVVVVGVDPRWVNTALRHKHSKQFGAKDENEDRILPSDYLEKIFQVPFHLKDADDASIKFMIEKLAGAKKDLQDSSFAKTGAETLEGADKTVSENGQVESGTTESVKNEEHSNDEDELYGLEIIEEIDEINIELAEIEQIKSLAEVIGNNPRCIKRFINIYRIIKTHKDFSYKEETKEKELLMVMFFLALSMGNFKGLVESFEYFLESKTESKNHLSEYFNLESLGLSDILHVKREKLKRILEEKDNELLKQEPILSKKHYEFIKRFTFKNM